MGLESLSGAAAGATPWGAIAQVAGGLIKGGIAYAQRRKGKKILKQIGESPDMAVPNEISQNQKLAELDANVGLPSEQYLKGMKNLQRNQSLAISNANSRRGGLAITGATQQTMNDGTLNLDVEDAKARQRNKGILYGANSSLAGWKNRAWHNNVKDKWDRKYQYGMSLQGAGGQNAAAAADSIVSGGLNYGSSGGFRRRTGDTQENLLRTDSSNYE